MLRRIRGEIAGHVPVTHGGRLGHPLGGGDRLVDFSSNVTPLGLHPSVVRALRRAAEDAHEYPDPHSSALLGELSRYTGLSRSNLLVGNGAVEIIYNFAFVFAGGAAAGGGGSSNNNSSSGGAPAAAAASSSNRGCALMQAPTFQEYEAASRMHGTRTAHFASMDLEADLDSFIAEIPQGGTVFVCNPNNPTGGLLGRGSVLQIVRAAAARSCAVMVDECFIEMSRPRESVLLDVPKHDNLLVLRSLTKSFGLAGVRLGYAAAPDDIAGALRGARAPWGVNCMAQAAGAAALWHAGEILADARRMVRKESAYLHKKISSIGGMACYDTSANFVLVRTRHNSSRLQGRLADGAGILVRDCSNFRGLDGHHIRVAVRRHKENKRLVRALEAAA